MGTLEAVNKKYTTGRGRITTEYLSLTMATLILKYTRFLTSYLTW